MLDITKKSTVCSAKTDTISTCRALLGLRGIVGRKERKFYCKVVGFAGCAEIIRKFIKGNKAEIFEKREGQRLFKIKKY